MENLNLKSLDKNYFWTERPKAVIEELKRHFHKVEDVSSFNDDTASVMINDLYRVYLPNSIRDTEHESNFYALIRDSELEDGNTDNFQFTSDIDTLIDNIQDLIIGDAVIKRSEVVHRMRMIMDDLVVIRQQFTDEQMAFFTGHADDVYTHFNNIAIACELANDESLSWKLYSQGDKNKSRL
jgi:hypothetical protein